MKNNTPLKKYNNGAILASSPDLAAIGSSYMQEVIAENKRRAKIREQYSQEMNDIADLVFDDATYGTWNISDRDWSIVGHPKCPHSISTQPNQNKSHA